MASKRDLYQQAQEHIKAKRYDDAIELLAQINHPKADAAIVRVEALRGVQKREGRNQIKTILLWIAGIIGGLFLVVLIGIGVYFGSGQAARDQQRINVIFACMDVMSGYDCDVDTVLEQYPDAVADCDRVWGDTSSVSYAACLRDKGVPME